MTTESASVFVDAKTGKGSAARRTLLGLGTAVYLISFLWPAVDRMPGWFCAVMSLFGQGYFRRFNLLIFASGMINPLALACLGLRMLGKASTVRRAIAITALTLIPLSWIAIFELDFRIEIGHVAWVVGLLLMMAPEAIGMPRAASPRGI